jgi:four helix bundle protein
MGFAFENLDTYKRAVALADGMESLCGRLKGKVSYSFVDQLSRAAMSVPLNLAEGNGRWHKNEKRQFFWIARGSVFEVVPILQMAKNRNHISENEYQIYYKELQDLSVMILRLIQSVDGLKKGFMDSHEA